MLNLIPIQNMFYSEPYSIYK